MADEKSADYVAGVEAAAKWLASRADDLGTRDLVAHDVIKARVAELRAALLPRPKTPREVWEEYGACLDAEDRAAALGQSGMHGTARLLRDLAEAFNREHKGGRRDHHR